MSMEPAPVKDEIFPTKGVMATSWMKWFAKLYDLLNITPPTAYTGPTTQVSAAPYPANPGTSRALDNIYQNLTGKPLRVDVSAFNTSVSFELDAYAEGANPPTKILQYGGSPLNIFCNVDMIVLPNYYYKVTGSTTPTIFLWVETY